MLKEIILTMAVCIVLFGCKDEPAPAPAPAVKQQKVIFEVSTISCQGDSLCQVLVLSSAPACEAMSKNLSSEMSSGWRVVTSTKKEKLASGSGPVVCEGTEYVLEK